MYIPEFFDPTRFLNFLLKNLVFLMNGSKIIDHLNKM